MIPDTLKLLTPPTLPQARSYLFSIQANEDDYASYLTDIQIDIPRLMRSYLTKDSYLSFTVGVAAQTAIHSTGNSCAVAMCLDKAGAFGLFDSIEVYDYLGSTLLERISGHAELMSLLIDADPDKFGSHVSNGTRPGTIASPCNNDAPGLGYIQTEPQDCGPFAGDVMPFFGLNLDPQVVYREYSIPILSFLGLLSDKLVPLHNGFTIIIKRAHPSNAFGWTLLDGSKEQTLKPPSNEFCKIKNVRFNAQILELGPIAEALVQESLNGEPMIVHTTSYRNYRTTWGGETSVNTGLVTKHLDFNINAASVKGILWVMRNSSQLNQLLGKSQQRLRNYLTSWKFHYGSSTLPNSDGIQTRDNETLSSASGSRAFVELMKALGSQNKKTFFNAANWNYDSENRAEGLLICPFMDVNYLNSRLNSEPYGRFACGLNTALDSDPGSISGLNCNGIATSIQATFQIPIDTHNPNQGAKRIKDVVVDAWIVYDAFISIVPGIVSNVAY